MTRTFSKRLVIDASVARAAGGQDATHETSKACRGFLQEVLRICHRLVWTPGIRAEWRNHMSGFSRGWLTEMMSRDKVVPVVAAQDAVLSEAIANAAMTAKQKKAMAKDAMLIEAAWQADRRVASLDDTARGLFGNLASDLAALRRVLWLNPTAPTETPLRWLADGAKLDRRRKLG